MGKSLFTSLTDRLNAGKPKETGPRDPEKAADTEDATSDIHRAQTEPAYNNHGVGNTGSGFDAHLGPETIKEANIESGDNTDSPSPPDAQASRTPSVGHTATPPTKKPISKRLIDASWRFCRHTKNALGHSWLNLMLVFVPIGIAAQVAHLPPAAIFAINSFAVIPLAGLLTHATETVALQLGDTLGALLNVSFGNAVELIIFIIALVKNEIRIVQASVLGSILANLLLILGMAFLFGGLRYREQLYNNTVTQMSACMLSLSVISLLLPTAFHASFNDAALADQKTLTVSRATSIVLLFVYGIYLLFQLKSHAHLYQRTPQELIDEEAQNPGVLADVFDTSSSSSTSSDDTDTTDGSGGTMKKRIKRAIRRRRRKSSSNSEDTRSVPSHLSSPEPELVDRPQLSRRGSAMEVILSGDEGDNEGHGATFDGVPKVRDFVTAGSSYMSPENPSSPEIQAERQRERKHKKKGKKFKRNGRKSAQEIEEIVARADLPEPAIEMTGPAHVTFIQDGLAEPPLTPSKSRPWRPGLPKLLSQNVFVDPPPTLQHRHPGLAKSTSLPDLKQAQIFIPGRGLRAARIKAPPARPTVRKDDASDSEDEEKEEMSRTAAVVMLLISTALVAVCAEFLVDAIPAMTASSNVSSELIGLIVLPIVGNAAEHVTAVTTATKNKMDLAIGVAVGSSIQIALFVTPLVVILGWCMNHSMSLYFTLFETVSLFVTTFVVNFLILDGRSNYLEGVLLIACYALITLCAVWFPNEADESSLGGSTGATSRMF